MGVFRSILSGSKESSALTQIWYIFFATAAFALTLLIPIGCMSPPTQKFALFSVDTHVLAHRYANTTQGQQYLNSTTNSTTQLDAQLVVLPDIYRIGMSGVCREYHNTSQVKCTKSFPQVLDLGLLIDSDINASSLTNASADHLRTYFNSLLLDPSLQVSQKKSQFASMMKASGGLVILSLVLAPLAYIGMVILLTTGSDSYTALAAIFALFDAIIVIIAAGLAIAASGLYGAGIELSLSPVPVGSQTSFWGATSLYPLSLGLYLFALAAFVKLIVLPIFAAIIIFVAFFAVMLTFFILLLFVACILGACGAKQVNYGEYWEYF